VIRRVFLAVRLLEGCWLFSKESLDIIEGFSHQPVVIGGPGGIFIGADMI